MHSRLLRYLDEVARAGSIRAAASRLNVASSAVNKQILMLEREVGTPLFERLSRGLRLTPAGELMVAYVRQTMRDYKNVEADIRDLKGLQSGEITLATMNGLAGGIAPQVAATFCARHPRIKVTIRVMFTREILRAVADGYADLGLAYNLPEESNLQVITKMEARLGAVVAPDHPLAGMSTVPLSHCASYPLIFADKTMLLHNTMLDAFSRSRLDVEPTILTNSIETMKFFVARGNGIAFLSKFDIAEEHRMGMLTYVRIRDRTIGNNTLSLVHRDKRSLGAAARLLSEDIRAELHATVDDTGRPRGK